LERKPRREAIEQVRRAIDDAVELSAQCLLLNVGGLPQGSRDLQGARDMVRDALGELLEQARSAGIALAIEPLHPLFCAERSCITTLTQANDLCQELAGASGGGVGVVVDVWQHWWDPALPAQIRRAGEAQRLLLYQIADWLAHAADSALTTTGRGMMGDGVIDLPLLRSWMEAAEYRGQHEVEVVSPMDWALRDIDEVLITARRRHQECS
jgi:sugar phosphate isomerase/epimerase